MSTTYSESKVLKAATNEYVLMMFRGVTTIALAVILIFVTGTREDTRTIARDLNDFKLMNGERIARIEGQVGELKGSVETHRQRISGNENDIRSIWQRLFDLTGRGGQLSPSNGRPP